jgi:hypothetical protein
MVFSSANIPAVSFAITARFAVVLPPKKSSDRSYRRLRRCFLTAKSQTKKG